MATTDFYLGARVGSGSKGARGLASFEEDIGGEDSNQGSLASEERKGQPVALCDGLGLQRRHGDVDDGDYGSRGEYQRERIARQQDAAMRTVLCCYAPPFDATPRSRHCCKRAAGG